MKNRKTRFVLSVGTLAIAATSTPVSAQVEEIIVTAQRRDQSAQDVPISMQVVSGDDLQDRQISGTGDLADSLPNVMVTNDSVSNNIYVRGVGSGSNAGFEQAVATFVDGVYHGRSRYSQSTLVDVQRIEVLRGPQTIFFGNNAIGGAFSVTTQKPSLSSWEGYAQGAYEFKANEKTVEAAVGGPIIEDRLGIRIAGRYSDSDGYIKNLTTGQDNPAIEDKFLRMTTNLRISDAWDASFKVEYGKQDSVGSFPSQLTDCPPQPPFSAATTFSCGYALAVGEESDFDFRRSSGAGEIGSIEANEYVLTLEKDNVDGPGIVFQAALTKQDFLLAADTDGVSADFFAFNTSERLNQKTIEARINSPENSSIEYTAGFYYLDTDSRIDTTLNFPFATVLLAGPLAPLAPFAPLAGDIYLDQSEKAMSLFGSVTVPVTDQLFVTAGARYVHSRKQGVQAATNATGNDPFGFSVTPLPAPIQPLAAFLTGFNDHTNQGIVRDDDFLPSFSLRYEVNPDVSVYAKFSQGFKAGGLDAIELTGVQSRLTFSPETVDAYEIGLRGLFADRTVSLNLALFRSDYKDLQQSVAQFTATSAFVTIANVGALRSQGVEAELQWRPNDRFELSANVAYLDAQYRDYANAGCTALQAFVAQQAGQVGCFQDLSGRSPPFAPNYSGSVNASYDLPIGDSMQLSFEGAVNFSGAYDVIADLDPVTRQGAWQKFDARVAFGDRDDRWTVALVGKNLTNERIITSAQDVVASAGSYTRVIGRGRQVALQLRYRFE